MPVAITRVFAAPRRRVFDTLADAAHLRRWLSSEGFAVPLCLADPRPGGALRLHMRASNGRRFGVRGTYREVAAPARLVIDCIVTDERRTVDASVEILLEAEGEAVTRLTLMIRAASSSACAPRAGALPSAAGLSR